MTDQEKLKKLFDTGIPCSECYFQSAVNNIDKVPENNFSDTSMSPTRRVDMSLSLQGGIVVFRQKNRYFWTPKENVKHGVFKMDEPKVG